MPKDYLIEWKNRIGEIEASKIAIQACRKGTGLHELAEKFLLNDNNYKNNSMPSDIEKFNKIKPLLLKNVKEVYGIELPLFSKILNTAGRTDAVVNWNGILSILDYKTSKWIKTEDQIESYFIQASTYAIMFSCMYDIKITQIVILMVSDESYNPLVFIKNSKDYYQKVIDIYLKQ